MTASSSAAAATTKIIRKKVVLTGKLRAKKALLMFSRTGECLFRQQYRLHCVQRSTLGNTCNIDFSSHVRSLTRNIVWSNSLAKQNQAFGRRQRAEYLFSDLRTLLLLMDQTKFQDSRSLYYFIREITHVTHWTYTSRCHSQTPEITPQNQLKYTTQNVRERERLKKKGGGGGIQKRHLPQNI